MGIKFFIEYRKRNNFNKRRNDVQNKYYDKIAHILTSEKMTENEIVTILGDDYSAYANAPKLFIPIITQIHLDFQQSYFPNMLTLCNMLGITDYCENNLLKERDVFHTLQFLCINNITIMEGRLANYVNHKDKDIRMMARLCYIFCAYHTPYKYLEDELNNYSEMKFMFLHFIFVWMKHNNKELPDFDALLDGLGQSTIASNFIKNEKQLLC